MPESFRTAPLAHSPASADVVVHCSDPRYQPHFQNFLRESLSLVHYALIAVPGGAHFLSLAEHAPGFSASAWRWMAFMRGVAKAQRVILIGHDDCRWYRDLGVSSEANRVREHIVHDLRSVRAGLLERFPQLQVAIYFATLNGDTASIHSL